MRLVIDIPEDVYKRTVFYREFRNLNDCVTTIKALEKAVPLPKGHGRLIDADKTLEVAWQDFYKHEEEWEEKDENYLPLHRFYDQNGFECCQQTIVNAPTIIGADAESEDKK